MSLTHTWCGFAREYAGQVDVGAQRQEAEKLGRALEVDLLRSLPLLFLVGCTTRPSATRSTAHDARHTQQALRTHTHTQEEEAEGTPVMTMPRGKEFHWLLVRLSEVSE